MRLRYTILRTFVLVTLSISVRAESLTILHINDHHSHLLPDYTMTLNLAGEDTIVQSGGFPAVVSTLKNYLVGNKIY